MSAQTNAPIIIKRVKKVVGGGHHGGAWKVAYADFVTAMMAFFMLMWLLNATTEKQRKGIADYFSPTIPITRASGGGDGAFGGDSMFTDDTLAHTGNGGVPHPAVDASADNPAGSGADAAGEQRQLEELQEVLTGNSGESTVSELARRHIVTQLTDEGLVIDLHDLDGSPLFVGTSAEPTPVMTDLLAMIAEAFSLVKNGIAVEGYVAAQPVVLVENTAWDLSGARAARVRAFLDEDGVESQRLMRYGGHADRKPVARNPMAVRNNRIELILLRTRR